jgi:hypothetical protein
MVAMDFFNSMVGAHLGTGMMRTVYRWLPNLDYVVKFEHMAKTFSNVTERDIWDEVKDNKPLARWFAPVLDISPCGNVLWQLYAEECPIEKLPKLVPECFADLKQDNWGLWKGRPICRDYGNHAGFKNGLSLKMKTAKWRY